MDWPSGLGGIGGRGRASTHGAFSWVDGCKSDQKRGGVPGRRRQRRELGGGVVRSRAQGGGVVGVRAEG